MTLTPMRNSYAVNLDPVQYDRDQNYSVGAPTCVFTRYDMGTQTSLKRHCHVSV